MSNSSIRPIGLYQVLPLRVRVNLETMAMKGHSNFPKAPSDGLVSYLGHLSWSEVGVLPFCRDAVGVFYSPNLLGWKLKDKFLN